MLLLIHNEIFKILHRNKNIFLLLLLIVLIFGMGLHKNIEDNRYSSNWKSEVLEQNIKLEQQKNALAENGNKEYIDYLNNKIRQNNFYITANVNPYKQNIYRFMRDVLPISVIVIFILLIITSEIICTEYNEKTISLLFLQPLDRGHIISAKFFTIILFNIIVFTLLFSLSWIIGGLSFGFSYSESLHLLPNYETEEYIVINYLKLLLKSISLCSLCFLLSIYFKNNILSIIGAIILEIMLNSISGTITSFNQANELVKNLLILAIIIIVSIPLSIIKIKKEEFWI